jgi:predicted nucleic acid-binding protein
VLVLDTSGILAALDAGDAHHGEAVGTLKGDNGPHIVPAGIMAELTSMIEARLGAQVVDAFLADLEEGAFTLECGEGDLSRIRSLMRRYGDLPLGYADAAVIAIAERYGARVLTYDLRHFAAVAREQTIQIAGYEHA